ncbi:hypothetical protein LCGC14_0693110 [marine sediment metagenome]|uniref:Uncharacterized protein n=1 Tax=marine sediment metagenome TaxID=412755 RepID=A0A0F9QJZ4_9ZZZZ
MTNEASLTDPAGIYKRSYDAALVSEIALRHNVREGLNEPWGHDGKKTKAELRAEGASLFQDPLLLSAQHREATQHWEMQPSEDGPTVSRRYVEHLKRLDKAMQEDE